jgi:hypothetical protein
MLSPLPHPRIGEAAELFDTIWGTIRPARGQRPPSRGLGQISIETEAKMAILIEIIDWTGSIAGESRYGRLLTCFALRMPFQNYGSGRGSCPGQHQDYIGIIQDP